MRILVTGGAGFIGSALSRYLVENTNYQVLVFDKLTYAGNLASLRPVAKSDRFEFVQGDICDPSQVKSVIEKFKPTIITHLAAESHVDRSIDGPGAFIQTNVVGTYILLNQALEFWRRLDAEDKQRFRFHHISTDEVFGSLGETGLFTETTAYDPRSPYSASKAGSDHLVSAWGHTFGLPVLITNCSNNYGPYHYPEKLIPLMIINALSGAPLPVYGNGSQVRDWLYVDDHIRALQAVFEKGRPGETYNVGGGAEKQNIEVVETICALLDEIEPRADGASYKQQISFVTDRPGHDQRYAIDAGKIRDELNWAPVETFESGLACTVRWYLDNRSWWQDILDRTSAAANRRGLGVRS